MLPRLAHPQERERERRRERKKKNNHENGEWDGSRAGFPSLLFTITKQNYTMRRILVVLRSCYRHVLVMQRTVLPSSLSASSLIWNISCVVATFGLNSNEKSKPNIIHIIALKLLLKKTQEIKQNFENNNFRLPFLIDKICACFRNKIGWPTPKDSWKLIDPPPPPLHMVQKLMTVPPPRCFGIPPLILLTSP